MISKKQFLTVIGVFLLVVMLGTITYAFFNYTRTGTANVIRTGSINFNTEQGDTVTLSDLFPIQNTGNITSETPGVGSLSIHVTGDTTYEEGIEYLVKAVNVTSAGNQTLPISIEISYEANNNKTIGTEDADYYDNRGGNTSIYKVLSTDTIEDDGDIVVGYIAPGQTGIDGNIVINAYLDAANIAITDTIEDGAIAVPGYDNGTSTDWIDNRTVFTTEEWNALQANGVSFQIKVEANEGVWVTEPVEPLPTMADMCPGCVFTFVRGSSNGINYGENGSVLQQGDYSTDYRTVIQDQYTESDYLAPYFLGLKLDGTGKVTNAYACGVINYDTANETPFCIEGTRDTDHGGNAQTISEVFSRNTNYLNRFYDNCTDYGDVIYCASNADVAGSTGDEGFAYTEDGMGDCYVYTDGIAYCS